MKEFDGLFAWDINVIIALLVFFVLLLVVYVALCFCVMNTARRLGRNDVGWFILSFFFTPYFGAIMVACLGETDKKRRERIIEDEELRQNISSRNVYQDSEITHSRSLPPIPPKSQNFS